MGCDPAQVGIGAAGATARRQVVQRHWQTVVLQALGGVFGSEVVGEQKLHRLKARLSGGGEAVEDRQLVVQRGEVGGELGPRKFRVRLA